MVAQAVVEMLVQLAKGVLPLAEQPTYPGAMERREVAQEAMVVMEPMVVMVVMVEPMILAKVVLPLVAAVAVVSGSKFFFLELIIPAVLEPMAA
jgi:hypothetical protein